MLAGGRAHCAFGGQAGAARQGGGGAGLSSQGGCGASPWGIALSPQATARLAPLLSGYTPRLSHAVRAALGRRSAFPVDTHIHRLAQRWGLSAGRSVEQTEADLKLVFPEPLWRDLHLQVGWVVRA